MLLVKISIVEIWVLSCKVLDVQGVLCPDVCPMWHLGPLYYRHTRMCMNVLTCLLCSVPGRLSDGDWCHPWPRGWQHTYGDGRGQEQAEWHHVLHWYQSAEGSQGEHGGYVSTQKWHEWVLGYICFCHGLRSHWVYVHKNKCMISFIFLASFVNCGCAEQTKPDWS